MVDVIIMFVIIGNGDVFDFEGGICVIGLGGVYVQVVVCVFVENIDLLLCEIVEKLFGIVGDMCIYMNYNCIIEMIE